MQAQMQTPPFGASDLLDCIGETPLVYLREPSRQAGAHLFGKCEFLNPGYSVKDRAALYIVRDAENTGKLSAGGTVVEGTAGNTGIGLAIVCAVRGYRCVLVIPDSMSRDKIEFLEAFGADVRVVAKKPWSDPDHYHHIAARLAEEIPGGFFADQFGNPANVQAHYETTGPEIWRQSEGKVDVLMAGMGTSATVVGAGRFLKEQNPDVRLVVADPGGSVYLRYVQDGEERAEGSSIVEGVGIGKIPPIFEADLIDEIFRVGDPEAVAMNRTLVEKEGMFLGGCSGLVVAGAVEWARRSGPGPDGRPWNIVIVLTDTGLRYLSKLYNPAWLSAQGL